MTEARKLRPAPGYVRQNDYVTHEREAIEARSALEGLRALHAAAQNDLQVLLEAYKALKEENLTLRIENVQLRKLTTELEESLASTSRQLTAASENLSMPKTAIPAPVIGAGRPSRDPFEGWDKPWPGNNVSGHQDLNLGFLFLLTAEYLQNDASTGVCERVKQRLVEDVLRKVPGGETIINMSFRSGPAQDFLNILRYRQLEGLLESVGLLHPVGSELWALTELGKRQSQIVADSYREVFPMTFALITSN